MRKEYLKKNERYTLLELTKDYNDLAAWRNKMDSMNHKEALISKSSSYSSTNPESYFLSKWQNISSVIDACFPNGEKFKYLNAEANCEYSKRKINDSQGNLLPKEDRLNYQSTQVLFIEIKGRIYCIAFTLDEMEIKRIRKLLRNSNIDKLDKQFEIDSELFSWLFFEEKNKRKVNNQITIRAINGFSGKIPKDESKFAGKSIKVPALIVTKTFLVGDYELTTINLKLLFNDIPTEFYIEQSTDEVKIMVMRGSGTDFMFASDKIEINMPIYMYFKVIPTIVNAFKRDEPDYEKKYKKEYLKELGIEVIRMIMDKNDISKDDI